jgi:hypothetical protein
MKMVTKVTMALVKLVTMETNKSCFAAASPYDGGGVFGSSW